jgi:lipid IVA palmitoyltransferase
MIFAAVVALLARPASVHAAGCANFASWIEQGCRHIADTFVQGDNSLLVSGYEWHLPSSWTPEARARENEKGWGAGLARTREHANGDTENVFFLVFKDSHRQPQYNLGYSWTTYWLDRSGVQPGLGFTAMIIRRPDITGGYPVPVALPLFTLRYQKAELLTTYVPKIGGGVNHGAVLYIFGKIDLK